MAIKWTRHDDGSLTATAHQAVIYDRGSMSLPSRSGNARNLARYPTGYAVNRNTHIVLRLGGRYVPCVSVAEAKREAERLVAA